MISLKASKVQQDNKVNVSSITNLHINQRSCSPDDVDTKDVKVSYGRNAHDGVDDNPYSQENVDNTSELTRLQRLCDTQQLVIQMMQDNPMHIKGYIVADDTILAKFIQILTGADNVDIEADDIGEGCFTSHIYRKVHDIYANIDNKVVNIKYERADVMKILRDLNISTKYVF